MGAINIFIQARMSSARFPGKILAPLNGKPILKHVIDRVKQVIDIDDVVVLTSTEASDDPVVAYLTQLNCTYFRGPLNNVFERFQTALYKFPCEYFVRISADSPFIDPALLQYMCQKVKVQQCDIFSNIAVRTFPKGQSIEIAKTKTFLSVDSGCLTKMESEHVFPYFYNHRMKYKISNVKNKNNESHLNFCVDTLEDLKRLTGSIIAYQFYQEASCQENC